MLFLGIKSRECSPRLSSILLPACSSVGVAERKVDLCFLREGLLRDYEFRDRIRQIARVEVEQAEEIVAKRQARIESNSLFSVLHAVGGIDAVANSGYFEMCLNMTRVVLNLLLKLSHSRIRFVKFEEKSAVRIMKIRKTWGLLYRRAIDLFGLIKLLSGRKRLCLAHAENNLVTERALGWQLRRMN